MMSEAHRNLNFPASMMMNTPGVIFINTSTVLAGGFPTGGKTA
jgi:hypothetical protein